MQITVMVFGLDTHQHQWLLVNRRLKPTKDRLAEHVIFPFQCKSKAIFSYFRSFFLDRITQNVYFVFVFFQPSFVHFNAQHTTRHPAPSCWWINKACSTHYYFTHDCVCICRNQINLPGLILGHVLGSIYQEMRQNKALLASTAVL